MERDNGNNSIQQDDVEETRGEVLEAQEFLRDTRDEVDALDKDFDLDASEFDMIENKAAQEIMDIEQRLIEEEKKEDEDHL